MKKLGQVPAEQGSLSEPTTAAYVFNGAYIPLACRLTQEVQIVQQRGAHLVPQVLRAGPNIAPTSNLGEALRLLPGETVHTQANTGADVPKVTSSIQLLMTAVTYWKNETHFFRWPLFCSLAAIPLLRWQLSGKTTTTHGILMPSTLLLPEV